MILKIKERIQLLELLPKSGNMVDMILARSIGTRINMDSQEVNDCDIKQQGAVITWNEEKDHGKEFVFNDSELRLLKDSVAKADTEKLITIHNLDVCIKIKDA